MNFRRLLSTLVVVFLTVFARAEQVVFSEIMYQPLTGKPEFIEISNITATPLDMAKWTFSAGITYTFPDFNASSPQAHILQPFERIIVSAASSATTRTAYPSIPAGVRIFGPWTAGTLANEGERVTLKDKNDVILCTVEYSDGGRWPVAADGAGHSIVLATDNKAIDDWRVWRVSSAVNGSPGLADPALPATGLTLNEVHFDANGRVDWVELRNDSLTTTVSATGFSVASKNDFSDKVALSANVTPGAVISISIPNGFGTNGDGEVKLYLVDSNNNARDAIKITRKLGRDCWQKFPAGGKDWYNGTVSTRDAQNDPERNTDIVINEIMADPPSNQRDGEFVELYNRGSQPVNVGGWKLKEAVNFTIPAGTTIQPGGYLVIGANVAYLNANYSGLTALGNWDGQLSNNGEMLKLDDENGNLVNAVDYRFGGEWPELAAGNGSSLELINPNTDNSVGSAWKDSNESTKSTFQTFSINGGNYQRTTNGGQTDDEIRIWTVGDSHMILKNLVLRPTSGSGNLFVNGEVTTLNNNNVDGWQARGTHWGTFHDAEGVHLVADGHGDNKCNHMEKNATGMTFNTGYTLEFQARWVWGKNRLVTQSWDTTWGGTIAIPIPTNLGTPGAANSAFNANPSAQVTALRHSPAVPANGQTVTVTARVSSLTPLQSVQVIHRLDNINANGTWNTTVMSDNGTGGDAVANDGIYTAQIVPSTFGYTGSAIVEFYVRATASNATVTELPRKGAAMPGLWAVASTGSTDLRRMRIVMSQYWLDALSQQSGTGGNTAKFNYKFPLLSGHYFPCTFISNDTDIYYGSSCRKTGSPFTRQSDNLLSRGRVSLPTDNPFRGKQKLYWDNDSGGSMLHNRIVRYWLYLFGVPANENEVCRVSRNSDAYAVKETNEVFDKDMLERIWPNGNNGIFYEMDDKFWIGDDGATRMANQDGSWQYKTGDSQGADNPTAYHNQFIPKSREAEYDYSGFIEWTKQLTNNGGGSTLEFLDRMADSRTITAYAAVRGYAADWDTLTGNRGKNGYMYQRSTDHKWTMLQWDSDLAFQDGHLNDSPIGGLAQIPTYFGKPYIKRQVNYFLTEMLNAYSANGPRISAWLDAEENASTAYVANKSVYQTWSTNRASRIQTYIGGALTATFSVTSSNANTTLDVITIAGTAPSTAFKVDCASQPNATLNWTTETNWNLAGIVLKSGVNNLVFRMLDMYGNPVGSPVNFNITKTDGAPPVPMIVSNPASRNAVLGEVVQLDGTGSYDPDAAGPLTYSWSVTPSTGVTISTPESGKRNLIFDTAGSYTVTLQVTDAASETASISRVFNAYAAPDFDPFGGDYLQGLTVANAELRDNYSPDNWYSFNETTGQLVVQVTNSAPRPLTHLTPTFPLFTRAMPSGDFTLQVDFSLENPQYGTFLTGLWFETTETGSPVKYAFGLENGTTFKLFRSFNGGTFQAQAGTSAYAGGPRTLRIVREGQNISFQRLVNDSWVQLTSRSGVTAVGNGGIFVAAGTASPVFAQTVRVAFDYFLVTNAATSSDLVKNLRVTEIMYNPAAGGVEYIEMRNIGTAPLNVAGAYFEGGQPWDTRLTFGNVVLDPGQYCVATNNIAAFQTLYGNTIPIVGEGTGGLANDTERLVLRDSAGNLVFDFSYVDTWYPSTDGGGKSLDIATTDQTQLGQASSWRASYTNGGSVGYQDIAPSFGQQPDGVTINPGQPFTLQVTATGTPTPTFQWRKGNQPIPGATSASYSVLSATENDQGDYDVVVTNVAGSAISNVATVSVNDPVTFTDHPHSQSANPGATATFSVIVSGTGPFTYQWRKGEQNLAGKTEATLAVEASELTVGSYDVVVTNVVGSATSNAATLSLNVPVQITTHPQDKTVNPDVTVTFTVEATGTQPFTYQWRKDGQPIDGETGVQLQFDATEDDEGNYDVIVSNVVGPVTSNAATLLVNNPVEITQGPIGGTINPGDPINLSVTATGTGPLAYQWWFGNQPINGETSPSLQILGATSANAGEYRVVVSNMVGPVTSDAATVFVNTPVTITVPPAPQTVLVGGTATFTVEAAGTGPLSFQWRKGTTEISGATSATFQIFGVTATDFGDYNVVVTNSAGSATSNSVALAPLDWKQQAGAYQGALEGPDPAAPATDPYPGRVTVVIAKTGKFTGTLEYFGLKHSFRGAFDINLKANVSVTRRGMTPVALTLNYVGAYSEIEVTAAHAAVPPAFDYSGKVSRIPVHSRNAPSPRAGKYTMLFEPGTGAPNDLTAPGYATVTIGVNGSMAWKGKLPDGATLKGSAWLNNADSAAFYSPLYVAKNPFAGSMAGPVLVTSAEITGALDWRKPLQAKGAFWPGGFQMLVNGRGWRYTPPSSFAPVITIASPELTLTGPIQVGTFTRSATITPRSAFVFPDPNVERVRLTLSKSTGSVSGSYTDTEAGRKIVRKLAGVIIQAENRAAGFFQGTSTAGTWELADD